MLLRLGNRMADEDEFQIETFCFHSPNWLQPGKSEEGWVCLEKYSLAHLL